jgi:hypothetical protein
MLPSAIRKLSALVAPRPRPERRGARRLAPSQLTPCLLQAADGAEPENAWVHNLSVRGVGLLTVREHAIGTTLTGLLVNGPHTFALPVEMTVVRGFRVVHGDFFVGAVFVRALTHDQLLPFLV